MKFNVLSNKISVQLLIFCKPMLYMGGFSIDVTAEAQLNTATGPLIAPFQIYTFNNGRQV